ncbi:hypothetical protein [Aliiglaciecola lipolytica]|jgi:hypothetical protein|uniref:hypothetical protein n=1 Tax=Aliiglaciecola lipolytica TaxID=477689 RepID=UPI001C08934E|nr:hypothetical protein [Aliiglaciecola lipolytica]MBU2876961.1 hypothetical protein [Aliiglaciecola lipolytica]
MTDDTIKKLKNCCACKSEIPNGATLCKECGTHQNWKRHFNFSSVALSLIVALLSVSTTFFTVVSSSVKTESKTRVIDISRNLSEFIVYADNSGDKSSRFGDIKVYITPKGSSDKSAFIAPVPRDIGVFLKPGQSKPFTISIEDQLRKFLGERANKAVYEFLASANCSYVIEIIESDKVKPALFKFEKPCASPYRKIEGNYNG